MRFYMNASEDSGLNKEQDTANFSIFQKYLDLKLAYTNFVLFLHIKKFCFVVTQNTNCSFHIIVPVWKYDLSQ